MGRILLLLTVLIPIFNEQETCTELIRRVKAVNVTTQVIVINDGSTDKSPEILKQVPDIELIHHSQRKGKGAAVRSAISHIKGDYVVLQDADLEYHPDDYQSLIDPILAGQADAVFGSRFLGRVLPRTWHTIGNKSLTTYANIMNGGHLTDISTCYKIIPATVFCNLRLASNGFGIDAEITAKLYKLGKKVIEIPISYERRSLEDGKKIRWWDGIVALWSCTRYRLE